MTPFEWAVTHGKGDLVELFVAKMEVEMRDRVVTTRASGVAAKLANMAAVRVLLRHGVRPDFEDGDLLGPDPGDWGYVCGYGSSREHADPGVFIPPLVYAVLKDDFEITEMLLAHGADANVGYHGVGRCSELLAKCQDGIGLSCGRVVKGVAEQRLYHMVRLLVQYGTDVGRETACWDVPGHVCSPVPRGVYLRVTAMLRRIGADAL